MMDAREINEIVRCMPKDRTLFYYFKDRYALELLAAHLDKPRALRDLKRSPYRSLLQKPAVQRAIQSCPDGMLTRDQMRSLWPLNPTAFILSLGWWGSHKNSRYYQTSRTGYNLVLHLNFSNQHNGQYRDTVNIREHSPFVYSDHPGNTRGRNTIAWARMDIDLSRGEALIEEIQNDWLREARSDYKYLLRYLEKEMSWEKIKKRYPFYYDAYKPVKNETILLNYFEQCVQPYERIWDEAMLHAAIWFLHEELGINKIFYNTWETGCRMKRLDLDCAPPRSLYSKLPRKFCFMETDEHPKFVRQRVKQVRKKYKNAGMSWYRLDL